MEKTKSYFYYDFKQRLIYYLNWMELLFRYFYSLNLSKETSKCIGLLH